MTEEVNADQGAVKEIKSEEKVAALQQILPHLDNNPNLIISGSLAEKFTELEKDGAIVIMPEHLAGINDIDVGSTDWNIDEIGQDAENISENTGFSIEVS